MRKLLCSWLLLAGCARDFSLPAEPPLAAPALSRIQPRESYGGALVTLFGEGFAADASANTVRIGTELAVVEEATDDRLVVQVPQLESEGEYAVTVTTAGGASEPIELRFKGPGEPLSAQIVARTPLYAPIRGLVRMRPHKSLYAWFYVVMPREQADIFSALLRERMEQMVSGGGVMDFGVLLFLPSNALMAAAPLNRVAAAVAPEARLLPSAIGPTPVVHLHAVEPGLGQLWSVRLSTEGLDAASDPFFSGVTLPDYQPGGAVELQILEGATDSIAPPFSLLAIYDARSGGRSMVQMDLNRVSPSPANPRPAGGRALGGSARMVPHPSESWALVVKARDLWRWRDGDTEPFLDRPGGNRMEKLLAAAVAAGLATPGAPPVTADDVLPLTYFAAAFTANGRQLAVAYVPRTGFGAEVALLERDASSERWSIAGRVITGLPIGSLAFARKPGAREPSLYGVLYPSGRVLRLDMQRQTVAAAIDVGPVHEIFAGTHETTDPALPLIEDGRLLVSAPSGEIRQIFAESDTFLDPIIQRRALGKLRMLDLGSAQVLLSINTGADSAGRGRLLFMSLDGTSTIKPPLVLGSRTSARDFAVAASGSTFAVAVVADAEGTDGAPAGELDLYNFPETGSGSVKVRFPVALPSRRLVGAPVGVGFEGDRKLDVVFAEPARVDRWSIAGITLEAVSTIALDRCASGCSSIALGAGRAAESLLDEKSGRLLVRMETRAGAAWDASSEVVVVNLAAGTSARLVSPVQITAIGVDPIGGSWLGAGFLPGDARCGDGIGRGVGALDPATGRLVAATSMRTCGRPTAMQVTPNGRVLFVVMLQRDVNLARVAIERAADGQIRRFQFLDTQSVGARAELNFASGLAFSKDGTSLFVTVPGEDTIATIQ